MSEEEPSIIDLTKQAFKSLLEELQIQNENLYNIGLMLNDIGEKLDTIANNVELLAINSEQQITTQEETTKVAAAAAATQVKPEIITPEYTHPKIEKPKITRGA